MYAQISRDFANVPSPKDVTIEEILFFYGLIKDEIMKHQQEQMNKGD